MFNPSAGIALSQRQMRKTQPESIKDILKTAVERIVAEKNPLYKEDIKKIWERVVGKEASKHSSPARIRGRVLIINVDSPTWIYQLNIKKTEIEKRLNRLIKQKTPLSIRLRAGEE